MKKIILFLLLVSSLYSEAMNYISAGYGLYNEKFKNGVTAQSSTDMLKLKVGYGDINAYSAEFSYEHIRNKSNIFSNNDGSKDGINIDLIKAFDLGIDVNPFFKAGIGSGVMKIDRTVQKQLFYGSFDAGTGFYIPVNKNFNFELAYEYKHTTYEGMDIITDVVSLASNTNIFILSFSVRY